MTPREIAESILRAGGPPIPGYVETPYADAAALARAYLETDTLLREVIGSCAPPVKALLVVHYDGKWIAPTTVGALREAAESLRRACVVLAEHEPVAE